MVLVHDGARPLVSGALIEAVARATDRHGAAIPVVPVAETVKRVAGDLVAETVDRSDLVTAQTPQGVRAGLLARAYEQFPPDGPETWTDEAALLEACRIPVHVVPGDPDNIKVTQPADLRRVESMVAGARGPRVGIGHDSHPFGPGTPLALGGIVIDGAPRLYGHSDGDVVLHALADALLGAAGLGDLGRLFPADGRTPRGIASTELLAEVRGRVEAAGWRPAAVDLTIVAARPRLAEHLDPMRDAIAALRRPRRETRSTSRLRPGTSTAPRAPAAGSRRSSWRRWRWRRDASACTTRCRARRGRWSRCATTGSASTRAARRSTGRPTSATSARSCSPTCWCASSDGAASR